MERGIKNSILLLFFIVCISMTKGYNVKKIYCKTNECLVNSKETIFEDGYYQFYFISSIDTFLNHQGLIINQKMQGKWEYYYRNKNILWSMFLINDTVNGVKKTFYETGKLESIGKYKGTTAIGFHLTFYENGNIKSEMNFDSEGKIEGIQREFYPSGTLKYEEIYPIANVNIEYNTNICGDGTMTLLFALENEDVFHGNEWYENGLRKVECKKVKNSPYTLEIVKLDTAGKYIFQGFIEYKSKHINCWFKTGKWVYYNDDGSIRLKEEW